VAEKRKTGELGRTKLVMLFMNSSLPIVIATMNDHSVVIYACAACGVLMVTGSIWLLKTGVIRLTEAARDGNLTVSIADKVKISTTYPALGLFIIGLAFVGMALSFSKPDPAIPVNIVGKIDIDNPAAVTVKIEPDLSTTFQPDSYGRLDKEMLIKVSRFNVVINAAGYRQSPFTTTLRMEDAKGYKLALDQVIRFEREAAPTPAPGNVLAVPNSQTLEPLITATSN
jgi:hypothetical protein